MSPELEKYLSMDNRLGSDIAHLTLELEDEERTYRRALDGQGTGYTWREFIVIFVIAALLLNSLAIHMGHQLGWWDPNELVTVVDQRIVALNSYESETVPLLYGARALGWLGETLLFIFFALPYQFLTLLAELLSMVLPVAVPYLPYAEGVILGVVALNILKACPLLQGVRTSMKGIGNAEVARSKKRMREIKQEIKAKEVERKRLPQDKVMEARQAEWEERRQREAEEARRKEERERQNREWEATKRRREEEAERERQEAERQREEEERQRREEAVWAARRESAKAEPLRKRIHDLYWDDTYTPSSTGSDILILSGDSERAKALAETLRRFCPDNRKIFVLSQIKQVEERLRSGAGLAVYLLGSETLSDEQLYRFCMSESKVRAVMVVRLEDDSWVNEEGTCPEPEEYYDRERRSDNYLLSVKRLDVWGLEMMYVSAELVTNTWKEGKALPFSEEVAKRFARYRVVAESNRKGWHLEGDTLVIDGDVRSLDGRAPWADACDAFTRAVLRSSVALASYDDVHRSLCNDWRLEGLFEGCTNLVSVDLSKMSTRFRYCEEFTNSFNGCPRLREVRIPECWQLVEGLQAQGFKQGDDGVWRRSDSAEPTAARGRHAR